MKEKLDQLQEVIEEQWRLRSRRVTKNQTYEHKRKLDQLQLKRARIIDEILQDWDELHNRMGRLEDAYLNAITS